MLPSQPVVASLALFFFSHASAAQDTKNSTSIYKDSKKYSYYGCYNETTQIEDSSRSRALADGITEVQEGKMTVPICLSFCSGGDTEYTYAGLEWSRECWCSQSLSRISKKLDDSECSLPCEGDEGTACGGALKLSVYKLSAASPRSVSSLLAVSAIAAVLVL